MCMFVYTTIELKVYNVDEIQVITQAIGSVGFPIVACGALFWMVNTTMKELTAAITDLSRSIATLDQKEEVVDNG